MGTTTGLPSGTLTGQFSTQVLRVDLDTVRVVVCGEVDLATQELLGRAIEEAVLTRPAALVVDVTGVAFMSVSAAAVLERARAAAEARGVVTTVRSRPGIVTRLLHFVEEPGGAWSPCA